jgi:hypothetical protein
MAVVNGKIFTRSSKGVSLVRSQTKRKHPNAQKHGIFAATAILPGEDPREFDELHSALIAEWAPDGATEEEAVLSIAKGAWRKRRVQKFLEVQIMKNRLDPNHASFDESFGLRSFAALLQSQPDRAFEHASRCLRPDKISSLESKFPRSEYSSTSHWAQAIIREINSMPESEILPGEAGNVVELLQSFATVSNELFKQELALDERLDAMIDRAVKRLIQTKAMKQMLGQTSAEPTNDRPKIIASRRSSDG